MRLRQTTELRTLNGVLSITIILGAHTMKEYIKPILIEVISSTQNVDIYQNKKRTDFVILIIERKILRRRNGVWRDDELKIC